MTTIADELSKPEYLVGTYDDKLNLIRSKVETRVGKISYGDTLHLVSLLARGLRDRIENCQIPELKTAWSEALQPAYLAAPTYSINLGLPEIRAMLDNGLAAGIVTADDYAFIVQLATHERQIFPDVTLKDVVAHFTPSLIDGQWHEVEETTGRTLQLQLNTRPPEPTHIVIQWQGNDGEWYHGTALHGLFAPVQYRAQLPYYDVPRKLRWKCEYVLDAAVSAV